MLKRQETIFLISKIKKSYILLSKLNINEEVELLNETY